MRPNAPCGCLCLWLLLVPRAAEAQLPTARLYGLFPAGGQAGSRVEVEVAGADLDGAAAEPARLIASHPGIAAEPLMRPPRLTESEPQVAANRFIVSIGAEVAAGTYELRVQGRYGLSNPRPFMVGSRPEVRETEPNNQCDAATELTLEAVANGVLEGEGDVDVYRLALGAARTLIVCEARQIDSRAAPTLVLHDEQGAQLATATSGVYGRAILDVTPARPAIYHVAVHDAAYGGDGMLGYVYRLHATTGPYIDMVFPPAIPAGQSSRITLYGRNIGGKRAKGVRIGNHELEELSLELSLPDASVRFLQAVLEGATAAARASEPAAENSSPARPGTVRSSTSPEQPHAGTAGQPPHPDSATEGPVPAAPDMDTQDVAGFSLPTAADMGGVLAWGEHAGLPLELAPQAVDGIDLLFRSQHATANPVRLFFAAAPLAQEREPNNHPARPQPLQVPCELVGTFSRADRDWYAFDANGGEALWIEVLSHRLGLPTDPLLVIHQVVRDDEGNEQALELAAVDDLDAHPDQADYCESKDPAQLFVAPADGRYRLMLRDLTGNPAADPRHAYCLLIRQAEPDFSLVALPRTAGVGEDPNDRSPAVWPLVLRAGGVETIDLVLYRIQGFAGEVEVQIEGLPPGVSAEPAVLGPGLSAGSVTLVADEAVEPALAYLRVVARATLGGRVVERTALAGTVPYDPRRPPLPRARVSAALPLHVLAEAAPFTARLGEAQQPALSTCRGGRLSIPVQVVRRGGFAGSVSFALRGGPPGLQQINELNLEGSASSGTLELILPGDCPTGRYTFSLMGVAEVPYARNPEAAAAAAARKAAVEAALPEVQAAANRAAEAFAAAEQNLAQARSQVEEGRMELDAAEQARAEADAQAAQTAEQLEAARRAAKEAPADPALAEQLQQATVRSRDAQERRDAALSQLTRIQEELAHRQLALERAVAEFDQAQQTLSQAERAAAEAAEWFAELERLAAELAEAAVTRGYAAAYPSTSVTIDVAEAPLELTVPAELTVAPGTSVELPISIVRLFGFEEGVSVELGLPEGAAGLGASGLYLEPQQTAGALRVEAAPDAALGTHQAVLRLSLGFNGQGVEVLRPLRVLIAAAPGEDLDGKHSP